MKNKIKDLCYVSLFFSIVAFWSFIASARTTDLGNPVDALNDFGTNVKKITARAGRITRTQFEFPTSYSILKVINRTNSSADVDFIAFDQNGIEAARETTIVGPKHRVQLSLQKLFPELNLSDISSVQIQSSVRAQEVNQIITQNITQSWLAASFFSQRDTRWSSQRLGTCSASTIGNSGCAISCIAMAASSYINCNPETMDTYLTKNGGYLNGCLVIWSTGAKIDGTVGFSYVGTSSVGSAANLKCLVDNRRFAIAKSSRFTSHYVIIIGYCGYGNKLSDFIYWDPFDLSATCRVVGDGWVTASSAIQIYK